MFIYKPSPKTKKKSNMKKTLLFIISLFILSNVDGALLVEYDRENNPGCVNTPSWITTDITSSTICRSTGIIYNSGDDYNSKGWTTNTLIDMNDYLEWSISVSSGKTLDLSTLIIRYDRSPSGPTKMVIRASLDSYSTDIFTDGTVSSSSETNTFTFPVGFTALTGTVTFRLYAFNASGETGTFDIEGFTSINLTDPGIQLEGNVNSSIIISDQLEFTSIPTNADNGTPFTLEVCATNGTSTQTTHMDSIYLSQILGTSATITPTSASPTSGCATFTITPNSVGDTLSFYTSSGTLTNDSTGNIIVNIPSNTNGALLVNEFLMVLVDLEGRNI